MKILVIQLARFGDIYQTWPALKGLRRINPEAEIHILVRKRFRAALDGMTCIDQIKTLATEDLLKDIIDPKGEIEDSLGAGQTFLNELRQEKYDAIYNLSYSRTGAFLLNDLHLNALRDPGKAPVKLAGYDLHSDGMLFPLDGTSSYFMAQVGVGKCNRFHLIDIFSNQLGVELVDADLNFSDVVSSRKAESEKSDVVIHIGASDESKTLEPAKWVGLIKGIMSFGFKKVTLVGAKSEIASAQQIENSISEAGVCNLVGQTILCDVFSILQGTTLFIGGDSSILQMASLVNCPSLNISTGMVSYWETGPRAEKSKIYYCKDLSMLNVLEVARVAAAMLGNSKAGVFQDSLLGAQITEHDEFLWNFIRAIYLGEDFPILQTIEDYEALQHFDELNKMALSNLSEMKKIVNLEPKNKNAEVLAKIDHALSKLSCLSKPAAILWDWLQVERVKIPPQELQKVISDTMEVHEKVKGILNLYSMERTVEATRG